MMQPSAKQNLLLDDEQRSHLATLLTSRAYGSTYSAVLRSALDLLWQAHQGDVLVLRLSPQKMKKLGARAIAEGLGDTEADLAIRAINAMLSGNPPEPNPDALAETDWSEREALVPVDPKGVEKPAIVDTPSPVRGGEVFMDFDPEEFL